MIERKIVVNIQQFLLTGKKQWNDFFDSLSVHNENLKYNTNSPLIL